MMMLFARYALWSLPTAGFLLILQGSSYLPRKRLMAKKLLVTTPNHELLLAVFMVYIALLFTATLNFDQFWVSIVHGWPLPEPSWFRGRAEFALFGDVSTTWDVVMLGANGLLFMPLGLIPPLLWCHGNLPKAVVLGIVFSLGIELVQLTIGRVFDLIDVVMNTTGAFLGGAVWFCVAKYAGSFSQRFYFRKVDSIGSNRAH